MCTVSIVPRAGGFRLVCNRDERRTRAAALEPQVYTAGTLGMVFPLDPDGGGTWIGVNDAGLAIALLNRTDDPARAPLFANRTSRGRIIPRLLRHRHYAAALQAASAVDATRFAPFYLLIVQDRRCGLVSGDGAGLAVESRDFDTPLLFTSSSLGDAYVDRARRRLFDELVVGNAHGWLRGQRQFHRHRWREHPQLSVLMERTDAMTVSRTAIDATSRRVALTYEALDGRGAAQRIAGAA